MNNKFVLNKNGVRDILRGEEIVKAMKSIAQRGASRIGDGYEVDSYIGKNRANVSIRAVTKKARKDNLQNNTLLKMLGASK